MPPAADAITTLASRVLDQQGAQRDLPRFAADPGSFFDRWTLNLPDVALAMVLAACAILLATVLLRLRRGEAGWTLAAEAPGAAGEEPAAHLAAAEAHAAAGRLMEAMHELLLQALADVRRHAGGRLDASLTSREILRNAAIGPAARDALGGMIAQVEWTYFGLRPASRGAWEDCRARLGRLGDALAAPA